MNTETINKQGITPLKPFFEKIDAITNKEDLIKTVAFFNTYGFSIFFEFYGSGDKRNSAMNIANIYQGGLDLPDESYYKSDDARSQEIRAKYIELITNLMTEANLTENADYAKMAQTIFGIEKKFAEASNTRLENRDPEKTYNKKTIQEWQEMTPGFDWKLFIDALGYSDIKEINIAQPHFVVEMGKIVTEISIEDWKNFLKWKIINNTANFIGDKYEKFSFDFYGKALSGNEKQEERWKRVLSKTSSALSEAIGQVYVAKHFPPAAKERMVTMSKNLIKAMGERIDNLKWMADETKQKAHEKLSTLIVKVGYPDKWRDYSKLTITKDSYVMNVLNAKKFNKEYDLQKIGTPVDKAEWHMPPQMVNAYYSPTTNEMAFPAAILQPPFFFIDADDAVNYGAIGVVIGHEMTHGFDDKGRMYDKNGNLSEWWTENDKNEFTKRTQLLINQYNNFGVFDSLHVDGELTLGENIADFGGLSISLHALKASWNGEEPAAIDGFTTLQRYFLSYAQLWRQNIRDKELMRRLKEDVHSPGEFRVNGAVFNVPEFYDAFKIKETEPLYIAPEKRPTIW